MKHVLVAEDSDDDFTLLRIAFEKVKLPHALHHVINGEETIQYLAGKAPYSDRAAHPFPHLLLLDIRMPLISGFEVLDFLRAHPDIKVPVVLMFSGSIIPEDAKKAVDLGATAYVSKPTDFDVYLTLARDIDRQWLAA